MTACPTCRFAGPLPSVDRRNGFELRHCPACDIVFSDPMKNPGAEYYESHEAYGDFHGRVERLPKLLWYHRKFLRTPRPAGPELLEIGFGSGGFLARARGAGWRVAGLDFSAAFAASTRKNYGIDDLHVGTLDDFIRRFPERRFDAVAFFEVLEHLDDPLDHMERVRRVLKPEGRVYLSTPNRHRSIDSIGPGDDPPHHLTRWSPRALRRFMRRAGFEIEELYLKPLDVDDVVHRISLRKDASSRVLTVVARPDEVLEAGSRARREILKQSLTLAARAVITALAPARLAGSGLFCRARLG